MNSSSAGTVFWITGLPGAGKSALAALLVAYLRIRGHSVAHLDGDALREVFGGNYDYSAQARVTLAGYYGRLSRLLASQGLDVVIATVSLFQSVHRWNRESIDGYREIYLKVPLDVLRARNKRGLYADPSGTSDFGLSHDKSVSFEEPLNPDLVIEHHGSTTPEEGLTAIKAKFQL